jgi:hypothetical protein
MTEEYDIDAMTPRSEPGWTGVFNRYQLALPGTLAIGTRIAKVKVEPGDSQPLGALGTILGCYGHPDMGVGYFVEWDALPRVAVFVIGWKIAPADLTTPIG